MMRLVVFFGFFKQKTAYEMRISDWSSDVCSSDLAVDTLHRFVVENEARDAPIGCQRPRLRSEGLGGEDAADRAEVGVPVQQVEVSGQLFHGVAARSALHLDSHVPQGSECGDSAVDVLASLAPDGDGPAGGVAQEQVDGAED